MRTQPRAENIFRGLVVEEEAGKRMDEFSLPQRDRLEKVRQRCLVSSIVYSKLLQPKHTLQAIKAGKCLARKSSVIRVLYSPTFRKPALIDQSPIRGLTMMAASCLPAKSSIASRVSRGNQLLLFEVVGFSACARSIWRPTYVASARSIPTHVRHKT